MSPFRYAAMTVSNPPEFLAVRALCRWQWVIRQEPTARRSDALRHVGASAAPKSVPPAPIDGRAEERPMRDNDRRPVRKCPAALHVPELPPLGRSWRPLHDP